MIKNNNFNLSADAQVCNNLDTPVKLEYDREREYPVKREHDQKVLQYGRSMIEMLGVLAIVGVLSVGGIAGYSKAMEKFKINKTIDQVSQIVTNIRTLYAQQTTYDGLDEFSVEQMDVLPDGLKTHAFNGSIRIYSISTLFDKAFQISLMGLLEDECIALATQDWGSKHSSGLISIVVNEGNQSPTWGGWIDENWGYNCSGGEYSGRMVACPNGSNISVPMPVAKAAQICKNCQQESAKCGIALHFQ